MRRTAWSVAGVLVLFTGQAYAEPLTEERVIELAAANGPAVAASARTVDAMAAQEVAPSLYPNPQLTWNREHILGDASEQEDFLFVSVPLAISGRRSAQTDLARSRTSASRSAAAATRGQSVTSALLLYYGTAALDREIAIVERSTARLEEAARVVARRSAEGSTSAYERDRVELAVELGKSRVAELRAQRTRAATALALTIGLQPRAVSIPERLLLLPSAAAAGKAPEAPASVAHLGRAAEEAADAVDSSATAWLPTISVSGGFKNAANGSSDQGYVAGISFELPVFSRGQDVVQRATTRVHQLKAQQAARQRQLDIGRASAEQLFRGLRDEANRFERETAKRVKRVERAVTSRYREGTGTILELLDAQKARTSVELRLLSLAHSARRAHITWRAAQGEFER